MPVQQATPIFGVSIAYIYKAVIDVMGWTAPAPR